MGKESLGIKEREYPLESRKPNRYNECGAIQSRLLIWLVMIAMIAGLSQLALTDWGAWAAIGAFGLAVLVVLGWMLHQVRLRMPLHVSYLIPRAKYQERIFAGAPAVEETPDSIVVGVGKYRLMHLIKPHMSLTIDPIVLRFIGSKENMPKREGADNPFIVRSIPGPSGKQYQDWNGDVHPTYQNWPRHFNKEPWVIGNRIETTGKWAGKAQLTFPLRDGPTFVKTLPFEVCEDQSHDRIPFLKGWTSNEEGPAEA